MNLLINSFKLIKRIFKHKFWVAKYCFEIGLYKQGIFHDMSKFGLFEFSRAVKYWHPTKSSLANERDINGYSETFLHHKGRNPHHYEYWLYHYSDERGEVAIKMPKKYMLELICDYLGACKAYGGDIKTEYEWFLNANEKMHVRTYEYISQVFYYIHVGHSLKESIKLTNNICKY